MSIILVILMYGVWSSVFSLGKIALQYSSPLFLTGARMTLAGVILLTIFAIFKRSSFYLNRSQLASIGILALFSVYIPNVLEFWGLQYLSAAKTCFIYSLSPFFAALFSYFHFNEKMTPNKWLGIGIGFLGCAPVFLTQTGSEDLFCQFLSWPTLAVIGAALSSVYGWIILRVTVKDQEISPFMANGGSMLVGGVIALAHSLLSEEWAPIPVSVGHEGAVIKSLLLMTFLFNILCYNLYGLLAKRFTTTFLAFTGLLSPVFASLNGLLFLGEPISWIILLSTGIVSFGLWVVYRTELRQGYIQ